MTVQLVPSWTWGDLVLTTAPLAFGFGADIGAPQTATEALAQLLEDGEVEVSERASNRALVFTVYVSDAANLLEAAQLEAAIVAEGSKKRNTLAFDPGDGVAPVTVFETFVAQVVLKRSDDDEHNTWREYEVTCKAAPYARSKDLVVTSAVSAPSGSTTPTITTINAGDSLPGWSDGPGPGTTLTDVGTALRATGTTTTRTFSYTPGSPIDLSTTRYVSLVMYSQTSGSNPRPTDLAKPPTLKVNGTLVPVVSTEPAGAGQTRYFWQVPPATTASLFTFTGPASPVDFYSLQRQDVLTAYGTTREKQRTIGVAGSARTQGSLAVSHPTSALGSTLVYTWPPVGATGYTPPLRQRRVAGGSVTADTALVSGARDLLDTAVVFEVPVAALIDGTHLLMARLRSDTNGDQSVSYSAQLRIGSTDVGPPTTGVRLVPFATTPATWRSVVLGRLALPPVGVPAGSSAVVRVTIVATSAAASNIDLDEAWLFNTSVGELSWVECGTAAPSAGGASNRLWLDSATVEVPRPQIYRGSAADRSDAFQPGADVQSFGMHTLAPPLTNVFTVTSGALDADVALTHYPRWHTHAAS